MCRSVAQTTPARARCRGGRCGAPGGFVRGAVSFSAAQQQARREGGEARGGVRGAGAARRGALAAFGRARRRCATVSPAVAAARVCARPARAGAGVRSVVCCAPLQLGLLLVLVVGVLAGPGDGVGEDEAVDAEVEEGLGRAGVNVLQCWGREWAGGLGWAGRWRAPAAARPPPSAAPPPLPASLSSAPSSCRCCTSA